MNKLFLIVTIISILFIANCTKDDDVLDKTYECKNVYNFPDTASRSTQATLKGHILFSWKNNDKSWNYAIAPNLNIIAAHDNVYTGNCFTGEECLKNNLHLFAEGEDFMWIARDDLQIQDGNKVTLSFPPDKIVNDIKVYCIQINIDLMVDD